MSACRVRGIRDYGVWLGVCPVNYGHLIGRFRPDYLKQHQPIQRPPARSIFEGDKE